MDCKRIVVLGNEYSSAAVFYYLERYLTVSSKPLDLLFVSDKNYYFFDGLLYDYLCDNLSQNELYQSFRSLYLFRPGISYLEVPEVSVNFDSRVIRTIKGDIDYKYLIIASGSNKEEVDKKAHFINQLNCFNFTTLQDAINFKKHILKSIEKASSEQNKELKNMLLTFSIIGGTAYEINLACAVSDYLTSLIKRNYPELSKSNLKINLITEKDLTIGKKCPFYNSRLFYNLNKKKITIYPNSIITNIQGNTIEINNNKYIDSGTVVTRKEAENSFLTNDLWCTDLYMRADGRDDVFVIGKSSQCLDLSEDIPKTAIFYNKQAKLCAENIIATVNGNLLKPFRYSFDVDFFPLGYRNTLVSIKDFYFSGILGWLLYRLTFIFSFLGWKKQVRAFIALLLSICGLNEGEILDIYETKEERAHKKLKARN